MKTFLIWFKNARYAAIPQSLLPALVALCFASQIPGFSIILGLLSVFGVVFAHLGSNLLDDYFDAKLNDSSYKDRLASKGIRARIAKCSYLADGSATLKQLFLAASVFSIVALIIGSIILILRIEQWQNFMWLVLTTGVVGYFYSGWPLRLSYHGLGELSIALLFGPLLMQGVFLCSCGVMSYSLFFISVPIGILVGNIVYTHAILDYEPDKLIHKQTLAVVLNHKTLNSIFSFLFNFTPYFIVIWAVLFGKLHAIYLFTLIPLPISIWLFHSVLSFQKNPNHEPKKKWFHFPMEQWKEVSSAGIGWFMLRWYTARNIIILFCLISSLIALFFPL
jgi:1,4-dihydroxy-2-naphthoate polyprenyltransferase